MEPHPYLQCGEKVRITRGSLKGIEGVLVRKKNLCRIVLSMDHTASIRCSGGRCQRRRARESVEFYSRKPESHNHTPELQELMALFLPADGDPSLTHRSSTLFPDTPFRDHRQFVSQPDSKERSTCLN